MLFSNLFFSTMRNYGYLNSSGDNIKDLQLYSRIMTSLAKLVIPQGEGVIVEVESDPIFNENFEGKVFIAHNKSGNIHLIEANNPEDKDIPTGVLLKISTEYHKELKTNNIEKEKEKENEGK